MPREALEEELRQMKFAFAFKRASRMGCRPLDRRLFRDGCVAERLLMWRPENVPQDIPFGDLIVGWLA